MFIEILILQLHKNSITRETDGVKNVRSSGSAGSFISGYQLIEEVTEREFPVYVIQPNPAAFTNFFSTFVSLSIATLGLILWLLLSGTAAADSTDSGSLENREMPRKNDVAAEVNGVAVTEEDVEAMIERLVPASLFHRDVLPEKKEKFRKEAIEKSIASELLFQEAARLGHEISESDILKLLKEQKSRFKSGLEFAEALKRKGLTEEAYRDKLRKKLLTEAFLNATVDKAVTVSDAELKDSYEAGKSKFTMPEMVRLREIFIDLPADADAELKTKKTGTAEEALGKAKAGEDFCELAPKYSEDDLKAKCGDTGYVPKGRLDETLGIEVTGMKEGEVKMVGMEKGLIIVKYLERKQEHLLSFDEVKERLRKELTASKRKKLIEELIESLRAKATIKIY